MIKRLRVRNYLSLKDIDLELGPKNLLVGPNMSGKSNLIDCLRFLSRMATSGLKQAFEDRGGFKEVIWKGGNESRISFELTVEVPLEGEKSKKVFDYHISILGGVTDSFSVERERLIVKIKTEAKTIVDLENGQGKITHPDGSIAFGAPISPQCSTLEFNVPGWEGTLLKLVISGWRFYRLIPSIMKQPNAAKSQAFLNEYGDNFSSWLMTLQTRYIEDFARIKQVATDVLPSLKEILSPPTQHATTYVMTQEKDLKGPIHIWRMSDGELIFLALLSLIFAPEELGAPLYCIEEPENHLHPKLLETLVEVLTQRQNELGSNAGQLVATTHSPHLVDKISLGELVVVEKSKGETKLTPPASSRHLKELLEKEEIGLGDLWYSGALGGV